jgi:DNA-binding transcriptional regulator YiaG
MREISCILTLLSDARYMNHAAWWVYDTAELGMRVRRARHERGLQQEELAERLGVRAWFSKAASNWG